MNIHEQLVEVFQEIFGDDDLTCTEATSPKDIAAWDSAAHVSLILTVEKKFSVKFSGREIVKLKTFGDILNAVKQKQG